MARATLVPITPSVLRWAIEESGFSTPELSDELELAPGLIESWLAGNQLPSLTQARPLAAKLKRPLASLLLPAPPKAAAPRVEFRRSAGSERRTLNPIERVRIRQAARLQELLSWLQYELHAPAPDLELRSVHDDPEVVAGAMRSRFAFTVEEQLAQRSTSAAWHRWREELERLGVFVLLWPMGTESCRGFSIWNEDAPIIAVNASWNVEARVFTLAHELGHLLTRTNSACLDVGTARRGHTDRLERWCEQVAAALLLPRDATLTLLDKEIRRGQVTDLATLTRIARRFRTSLRAAALRLIELDRARWPLYLAIPASTDRPRSGGGGGGRTRSQLRLDQYGSRAVGVFASAVRRDVLTTSDFIDYLDVPLQRGGALLESELG